MSTEGGDGGGVVGISFTYVAMLSRLTTQRIVLATMERAIVQIENGALLEKRRRCGLMQ